MQRATISSDRLMSEWGAAMQRSKRGGGSQPAAAMENARAPGERRKAMRAGGRGKVGGASPAMNSMHAM